MANKKVKSPVFLDKKPLRIGDLIDYYNLPTSALAMPEVTTDIIPVQTGIIPPSAEKPPTQASISPAPLPQYVSEQDVMPVKQYPPGSGLSAESRQQEDIKNVYEDIVKRSLRPTSEEIERAREAISYEPRLQEIEAERAMAAEMLSRAPSQVNLMPLMALVDAWTGSKFATSYRPPENIREKLMAKIAQTEDQRRKLEDQIIDYLKVKSGEQLTKNLLQSGIDSSFMLGSKAPAETKQAVSKVQDKFNPYAESARISRVAQKINERLMTHAADLKEIETYLSENPTIGTMKRISSVLARVIGREKGALAEGDVRRQEFTTLEQQLKNFAGYLAGDPSAKAPEKVVKEIKDNVRRAKNLLYQSGSAQIKTAMETEKATEGGKRLGKTVEEIFSPGLKALKDLEYKSDFQKFLEAIQQRRKEQEKAGGK